MTATLVDLLERVRESRRGRAFLRCRDDVWSARELAARAGGLAGACAAAGVGSGDRVAVLLDRSADEVAATFACAWLGALAVPIHQRAKDAQVAHVLEDCRPRVVLTNAARRVALLDVEGVLAASDDRVIVDVDRVVADASAPPPAVAVVDPDSPAAILYTSGSTGRPKGIVQSHRSLVDGARIVAGYLGLTPADHVLAVLPLSFDYGWNQVLGAAWAGAEVTLLPFVGVVDVARAVDELGCTGLAGVPTLWLDLVAALDRGAIEPAALATLRYVTNTGGRLPQRVRDAFAARLPAVDVFAMYGLTEAFRSSFVPPAELAGQAVGSIGRPIDGVELLVVDPETRQPLPDGEPGELVHCGACVAVGYWERPDETARRFGDHPVRGGAGGRCVFTGDLARRDADGTFVWLARLDRQLKIKGHRVSPDEVAEIVERVPGVHACVVYGAVDLDGVEHLTVVVEPATDAPADLEASILRGCRRDAPSHLVPERVVRAASLPRGPNGKVDVAAVIDRVAAAGGGAAS